MRNHRLLVGCFAVLGLAAPSLGGSHMWRFTEVFSDASGTIQFIEFFCNDAANEVFMNGLTVTTPNGTFTFPENFLAPTTDRYLLLATNTFASLPGAPTPDYIIPDNFIPLGGGFIRYRPEANYDTWIYGAGVIPTDGIHSVQFTSFLPGSGVDTYVTDQVNNPTNYQGGSGSVDAGCIDNDGDGFANPGDPNCAGGPQTDCDDSNPDAYPGAVENEGAGNCGDGADNDCNGLTDCAEAACANVVGACIPTVSEWGVAVLTLTLLSAGSVMLRGRMA